MHTDIFPVWHVLEKMNHISYILIKGKPSTSPNPSKIISEWKYANRKMTEVSKKEKSRYKMGFFNVKTNQYAT